MPTRQAEPITVVIACAKTEFEAGKELLVAKGFKAQELDFGSLSTDGYSRYDIDAHERGKTRVVFANGSLAADVALLKPQFVVFTEQHQNARREITTYPERPCLINAKGSVKDVVASLLATPTFAA